MLTFPLCGMVDYGLYRCHGCKISDISACCVFWQITTTEKEKTEYVAERKNLSGSNQPLKISSST